MTNFGVNEEPKNTIHIFHERVCLFQFPIKEYQNKIRKSVLPLYSNKLSYRRANKFELCIRITNRCNSLLK